jgi:predicted PurR-regulated permease PerM
MLGMDERALRVIWTIFLFGLLLAVVYYIRETILVFAVAIFFAYMLSPIVALIERFIPRKRTLALAIVYVLLIGALTGIGFALIPTLANQATSLATRLPALLARGKLATLPLPGWLEPLRVQIIAAMNREASNIEASVVPFIQETGTRILSGLGYAIPVILIPILAFFFLKDGREILLARSAPLRLNRRLQPRSRPVFFRRWWRTCQTSGSPRSRRTSPTWPSTGLPTSPT